MRFFTRICSLTPKWSRVDRIVIDPRVLQSFSVSIPAFSFPSCVNSVSCVADHLATSSPVVISIAHTFDSRVVLALYFHLLPEAGLPEQLAASSRQQQSHIRSPRRESTAARGRCKARRTAGRSTKARWGETSRWEAWRETRRSTTSSEAWSSNTSCRALQTNTCASARRPADTWACCDGCRSSSASRRTVSKSGARVCGWWSIERAGHHVGATNDSQTKCALLFGFDGLIGSSAGSCSLGLTLYSAELFGVGEDEVHVLWMFGKFVELQDD